MLLKLPKEILDSVFEALAATAADSRSILPLATISKKSLSSALRSAFHSICLLQTNIETVQRYTQHLKHQRTRRLLVSFKDLDSTPVDSTLEDLLDSVRQLDDLVLYLCEAKRFRLVEALDRQRLRTLDFGSFTSVVSFDFADLCRYVKRSSNLRSLSWEVVGVLAELPEDFAFDEDISMDDTSGTEERHASKVHTLQITCPAITDDALLLLIDLVRPTLKTLKLKTTAVSTLLTPAGIERALANLPSLENLTLDLSTSLDSSTPASYPCETILDTLPRLRHLSLTSARPLATIAGLARSSALLETLHMGLVNFVGAFEEKMLALSRTRKAFPNLRVFRVELDGRTISSVEGATSMESGLKALWRRRRTDFILTRTGVAGEHTAAQRNAAVVSA